MEHFERVLQLQRGRIDLETGEFPLRLATNGEASDGHILNLSGMQVADRLPMFVNHLADPTTRMGGLIKPRIEGNPNKLGRAQLHMTGVIDVNGDSALADIRRDVAQGISVGDINAMSIRWDPTDAPIPRSQLSDKHFAHSDAGADGFHTPMFFPSSVALEGSIVGVGADAAALIGRSNDTGKPAHVREFYEILVRGNRELDGVSGFERDDEEETCYDSEAEADDNGEMDAAERERLLDRIGALEAAADTKESERREAPPIVETAQPAPIDFGGVLLPDQTSEFARELIDNIGAQIRASDARTQARVQAIIDRKLGRIHNG